MPAGRFVKKPDFMNTNQKFERTARQRQQIALVAAILLHLAVFAAVTFSDGLSRWIPDFVQEWVSTHTAESSAVNTP